MLVIRDRIEIDVAGKDRSFGDDHDFLSVDFVGEDSIGRVKEDSIAELNLFHIGTDRKNFSVRLNTFTFVRNNDFGLATFMNGAEDVGLERLEFHSVERIASASDRVEALVVLVLGFGLEARS